MLFTLVPAGLKITFRLQRHPADMTADDWNLVMLTNSLLNGLIFDPKRKTLKIAREPGKPIIN